MSRKHKRPRKRPVILVHGRREVGRFRTIRAALEAVRDKGLDQDKTTLRLPAGDVFLSGWSRS